MQAEKAQRGESENGKTARGGGGVGAGGRRGFKSNMCLAGMTWMVDIGLGFPIGVLPSTFEALIRA